MRRSTKIEIRLKAQRLYRFRLRGLNSMEIARVEGVPDRTVRWYLSKYERLIDYQLKHLTVAVVAKEFFSQSQERQRELWRLYASAHDEATKVQCLRLLGEEDDRMIRSGQALKLIPTLEDLERNGKEVNVHVNTVANHILQLPTDQLQAYMERETAALFGGGAGTQAQSGRF